MPGSLRQPPDEVLDLFAVPPTVEPIAGGQGRTVRAGDLVLSPGRDAATAAWLNPVLARLAVRLDERPGRRPRDLRLAMPVPARDGSWVVHGWGASRFEPGTEACRDLDVTLAAGRLLHAELAVAVPERPADLAPRTPADLCEQAVGPVLRRTLAAIDDRPLGVDQLVHADLAGNVLLDALGAPVVIDVSPAWRPVLWAEAVCVLDSVVHLGAPDAALARWVDGVARQALLRAIVFRVLSDPSDPGDPGAAYRSVLDLIAA